MLVHEDVYVEGEACMCMYWYGYDLVLGWLDACGLVSNEDVRRCKKNVV